MLRLFVQAAVYVGEYSLLFTVGCFDTSDPQVRVLPDELMSIDKYWRIRIDTMRFVKDLIVSHRREAL